MRNDTPLSNYTPGTPWRIAGIVACHQLGGGMNTSDTSTSGTSTAYSQYDPDRQLLMRELAGEMYGQGSPIGADTGTTVGRYYDPQGFNNPWLGNGGQVGGGGGGGGVNGGGGGSGSGGEGNRGGNTDGGGTDPFALDKGGMGVSSPQGGAGDYGVTQGMGNSIFGNVPGGVATTANGVPINSQGQLWDGTRWYDQSHQGYGTQLAPHQYNQTGIDPTTGQGFFSNIGAVPGSAAYANPQGQQTSVPGGVQTSVPQGRGTGTFSDGRPGGSTVQRDGSVTDQNGNVIGRLVNGTFQASGSSAQSNSQPGPTGGLTVPDRSRGGSGGTMPVNGTVYNGATNNPGNARMPVNPVNYPAGHQGPGVVPFQPPIGTAPGTGGNPGGGGGNPGGTGSFGGFQTPGGIIGLQPGNDINPTEYGPPVTEWGQGGASGNRELAGGQAYQGYSGMVNNGGYDAATQNAITQTGENTARAGYAGAADQAARHAQATGNTAGYNSAIARLGQAESGTISDNARQNQIAFANEKQRQKEAGLQGLGGLYGGETNYLENLFGQRSGLSSTPLFKSSTTQGTGNVVGGSFNLSL